MLILEFRFSYLVSEAATIHYALKSHTGHVKTLCDEMN